MAWWGGGGVGGGEFLAVQLLFKLLKDVGSAGPHGKLLVIYVQYM
jgi:hypothetical protein